LAWVKAWRPEGVRMPPRLWSVREAMTS